MKFGEPLGLKNLGIKLLLLGYKMRPVHAESRFFNMFSKEYVMQVKKNKRFHVLYCNNKKAFLHLDTFSGDNDFGHGIIVSCEDIKKEIMRIKKTKVLVN